MPLGIHGIETLKDLRLSDNPSTPKLEPLKH